MLYQEIEEVRSSGRGVLRALYGLMLNRGKQPGPIRPRAVTTHNDGSSLVSIYMTRIHILCWVLLLAGCQFHSPAEGMLDDYLTRLARVLGQDKPEVVRRPPVKLPAMRDLQAKIEPLSMNLLEYWEFRECGLAPILAERNSVLGRVMPPSQALHMDGRLLRQLAFCATTLQDEAMRTLTLQLIEQKRAQWPLRYWNATVAGPELRHFWSPASEPLAPTEDESYLSVNAALSFLTRLPLLLDSGDWPERPVLEHHYQQLESYQLGGRLLHSLQLGSDYLLSANRMLDEAIENSTLCPYRLQRRELAYARNVMTQVFVGQVQTWFAALNRNASALLAEYDRLIAAQAAHLQPRIAPHQSAVHQSFDEFRDLNRAHVKRWKMLFERCGSDAIPSE